MGQDEACFTRLYEQFYPRVLAYALRRVPSDQARDAVDETFLIAWRRLAELPDAALPWLLVTARNTLADQLRRGRRQDVIAEEVARCSHEVLAGPDVEVVERITVLSALAQLSERDRDVLMLTIWDGLSHREAAVVAGCSMASFAVRLHRARRRFAAALDQQENRLDGDESAEPKTNGPMLGAAPIGFHRGEEQS